MSVSSRADEEPECTPVPEWAEAGRAVEVWWRDGGWRPTQLVELEDGELDFVNPEHPEMGVHRWRRDGHPVFRIRPIAPEPVEV